MPHVFNCHGLSCDVSYSLFVPSGVAPASGWPLIIILHGDGRNFRSLAEDPVTRNLIARQPFAVLCPDGQRSWWIDSPLVAGSKYQTMLLELLAEVSHRFPISTEPKQTVIMGWSMGGFGAVRFAEDHRGRIGALATVMALVDFPNPHLSGKENYGIPPVMADTNLYDHFNCMTKADQLRGLPILQLAPTNGFDFAMNRNFHARLGELGITNDYREIPGRHDWPTVRKALPVMLRFASEQLHCKMSDKTTFPGIDLGGTQTAVVPGNALGQVYMRAQFATGTPAETRHRISEAAANFSRDFIGIGVAYGGRLDIANGRLLAPPNLPEWKSAELVSWFPSDFQCPVSLVNDEPAIPSFDRDL